MNGIRGLALSAVATVIMLFAGGALAADDTVVRRVDESGHRAPLMGAPDATRAPLPGASAIASSPTWTSIGPFGGDVSDVAYSPTAPNVALAGFSGALSGLYRSTDAGRTWAKVSAGFFGVHDIEFAADGTVYLATSDGVWGSVDDGLTWNRRHTGFEYVHVFDVTLDRTDPQTIWAAVSDGWGHESRNVLLSTDGGRTWVDRTPPIGRPTSARAIAVDPTNAENIVAVFGGDFGGGQVWVSQDRGATWVNRSTGLPPNPMHAAIHLGDRILVGGGMRFGSQFVGLYASSNSGATWVPLHTVSWPTRVVEDILFVPPSTLWVATDGNGLHRSDDGGATWKISAGATTAVSARSVRAHPGQPDTLAVGAVSLGVLRSTDGGDLFSTSNRGMTELLTVAVDVHPSDPQRLAVAFNGLNNGGVMTSTNGGATWTLENAPPTRYGDVRFSPEGVLYAISTGPSTVAPEGLYVRRLDGSWSSLGPDQGPLYETDLKKIEFSTASSGLILLSGSEFTSFKGVIWRSANAGQSWERVYLSEEAPREVEDVVSGGPGHEDTFVATYSRYDNRYDGGVLRSTDGGVRWKPAGVGMPTVPIRGGRLCRSTANPGTLYQSFGSESKGWVYSSQDAGYTWQPRAWVDYGFYATEIACDFPGTETVYRGVDSGMLRSRDGALTFESYSDGLPWRTHTMGFAVAEDHRIYAATNHGVFTTRGESWIFGDSFE